MIACYYFSEIFAFFFSNAHLLHSAFLFLYSNKLMGFLLLKQDFEHCLISCKWLKVYYLMKHRLAQFFYVEYSYFEFITKAFKMYYCFKSFILAILHSFCMKYYFLFLILLFYSYLTIFLKIQITTKRKGGN